MKYLKETLVMFGAIALLSLTVSPAQAQVCEEQDTQSALQYLRRASLDLRGHLPTVDELNSVVTNQAIDPAIIDSMVDSDEFLTALREYHRDLLWVNVTNQRLTQNTWLLATSRRGNVRDIYYVPGFARANSYRGAQISCQNKPQSELGYDAVTGLPNTETTALGEQEGYVEVQPYWAPDTTIKVCAFDAQDNLQGNNMAGRPVDCNRSVTTKNCGCGPNLQWCHGGNLTQGYITRSWNEQMFRFIDNIVSNDRPYTDVLTAKDMEINGPISGYFRNLWSAGQAQLLSYPVQNYDMPEIPFNEIDTWQTVERGVRHAGILTMPGFLVKFQSDRGRANRFYNAFLCQDFQAPEGGLPASDDDCHNEPNLSKRCGCKYCHQSLEPAAAHWGRWVEAGVAPMNEDLFPKFNPECLQPGANRNLNCRRFYLLQAQHPDEEAYEGTLLSYVFAEAQTETNITEGPIAIAQTAIESGAFASCTVKKMWSLYMNSGRADPSAETLDSLTEDFKTDYNLRRLVKNIVARGEYLAAGHYSNEKE